MFADLEQEEGSREFQNLLLMTTPLYWQTMQTRQLCVAKYYFKSMLIIGSD